MGIPGLAPEYEGFFVMRLCDEGEDLDRYGMLFDLSDPAKKRAAFARICAPMKATLIQKVGLVCMLRSSRDCDPSSGLEIDHLIPLSSNKLNKEIRGAAKSMIIDGHLKKAPTESFGSNHPRNLALACKRCNAEKKHRFLDRQTIKRVLSEIQCALECTGA